MAWCPARLERLKKSRRTRNQSIPSGVRREAPAEYDRPIRGPAAGRWYPSVFESGLFRRCSTACLKTMRLRKYLRLVFRAIAIWLSRHFRIYYDFFAIKPRACERGFSPSPPQVISHPRDAVSIRPRRRGSLYAAINRIHMFIGDLSMPGKAARIHHTPAGGRSIVDSPKEVSDVRA